MKLRRERRLSQAEVAEHIGVCQSAYCAWESDRAVPSARHYNSLAALFAIDLAALLSGNLVNKISPQLLPTPATPSPPVELQAEIIQAQRETITLQRQRIENLEAENKHLQHRLINSTT